MNPSANEVCAAVTLILSRIAALTVIDAFWATDPRVAVTLADPPPMARTSPAPLTVMTEVFDRLQ